MSLHSSPGRLAALGVMVTALAGATLATAPVAAHAANPYQDFDSTVSMSNCSASLVKLPNSVNSDKALVLTNGGCVPDTRLGSDTVLVDVPVATDYRDATIMAGPANKPRVAKDIHLDRVVYATMQGTDVALISTDVTYGQLAAARVAVRPLSAKRPAANLRFSLPSTYWGDVRRGCSIARFVDTMYEGDWTWQDSMRMGGQACQGLRPGASGTPMVDESTGAVVGIANTVQSGSGDCSEDNPCEDTGAAPQDTSYGQQTYQLTACVVHSRFQPTGTCQLPTAG